MIHYGLVATDAIVGAVIASYVTTAALRATDEAAPTGSRSRCDACQRTLSWLETLPIVSFATLGGRCRTCTAPISPYHPIGEMVGLGIGVAIGLSMTGYRAGLMAVMAAILLAASVIDARIRILPDLMVGAVALIATVLALTQGASVLVVGLIASLVSLVLLGGLAIVYKQRRGAVGLGLGDVKLIAALAVWLGAATPWMVLVAAMLGTAAATTLKPRDGKIVLGPMIAGAGFVIGVLLETGVWPRL